ncbi:hypothetical protein Pcinc_009338 [Petrolisthes cinctipes]|uniref:G-patch domain-containing protein n=1 Tax=Petrolisthes cinctipes TaxID=88211 RepID=A0AAE1G722_PETCI|nr:hypothetical protein Pcinc_009331 [Petrolisthes cinctipes]KAK3886467.1 hypothetical protein Pcinc_009338 [Petrolisthes cinctipes]
MKNKGNICDRTSIVQSDSSCNDGATSKSHWLSTGLSGLTSLINEKKKKAYATSKTGFKGLHMKENPHSKKINSSFSQNYEIKDTQDIAMKLVSSPESDTRTCCVVDIKNEYRDGFINKYHKKHWLNKAGEILIPKCFILEVHFNSTESKDKDGKYRTRKEYNAQSLTANSALHLIEFQPPPVMPQGNVGTPTRHFKELIRLCQLPGTVIRKLGLEFPRSKGKKRFSQVPFNYGTRVVKRDASLEDESIAFTASGHLIPSSAEFKKPRKKSSSRTKKPQLELEEEREDGAEVEEWERYETFHEDVTSQDRIKERRFEEELEVTWEKGGSGLVFYTDAQFWREQQGDFDEQTADEWDVDMSVYYQQGAGDKDALDSVAMLESNKLRNGKLTQSAFSTGGSSNQPTRKKNDKPSGSGGKKQRKIGPADPPAVGQFEEHTRGVGRRLMEAQGWQEGQGLGRSSAGMPYALDNDGQHPRDKKGFGYHGVKLQGWGVTRPEDKQKREQQQQPHLISTVFDKPDPPPPHLRTAEPTTISRRPQSIQFTRPASPSVP